MKFSQTIIYNIFAFIFSILVTPFRLASRAFTRKSIVQEYNLDVEYEETTAEALTPLPVSPPIVAAPPNQAVSLAGSVFDPRRRVGVTLIGGFAAQINQPKHPIG